MAWHHCERPAGGLGPAAIEARLGKGFGALWTPGEAGAAARLDAFIADGLAHYADERDRPDRDVTSRLSPHLRFGEVSPAQCWHAVRAAQLAAGGKLDRAAEKFLKEVLWREFSYHLLHHWPTLPTEPFRPEFRNFPWTDNSQALTPGSAGAPDTRSSMPACANSGPPAPCTTACA
jgi:deoxyribodipyrimidine photo-lyase